MLRIIAASLVGFWLIAFFALHLTSPFIHVVLAVGLVFFVIHLREAGQRGVLAPKSR